MASQRLKVVVVGAGDMGLRHLQSWKNLGSTTNGAIEGEIVGLVDDAPARLDAARESFGLNSSQLFSDYRAAFAQARPDVVSVCVPTAFHVPVGLVAVEYGAHILIEKPLALSLDQADAIIEAAERKGVVLAVGFMLRYSPALHKVKEWVEANKLGRPLFYFSENLMEVRPKVLMHHKNVNGGPLMDFWCHHFDMWSLLFDSRPVSVAGYGAIFAEGKSEVASIPELAIDTAGVIIRYENGDVGQLSTTWGLPRGLSLGMVSGDRLVGPNGIVIGDIRKSMTLHALNGRGTEQIEVAENNLSQFWQEEITDLAKAIVQGKRPLAGGPEGREALRLSLAALEAIETGRTVTL